MEFGSESLEQALTPFRSSEFEPPIRSPPPCLRKDTEDVLAELALTKEQIDVLVEENVVRTTLRD